LFARLHISCLYAYIFLKLSTHKLFRGGQKTALSRSWDLIKDDIVALIHFKCANERSGQYLNLLESYVGTIVFIFGIKMPVYLKQCFFVFRVDELKIYIMSRNNSTLLILSEYSPRFAQFEELEHHINVF